MILITKVKFWIILTKGEEQFTANPKHLVFFFFVLDLAPCLQFTTCNIISELEEEVT